MSTVHIDLGSDIHPVSDFRAHSAAMLKQVRETRRPIVLTQNGRGAAVILDIGEYQRLLDQNETLRDVQQALADVEAGRTVGHDDARQLLLRRFAEA